jgi:hypothetical protein
MAEASPSKCPHSGTCRLYPRMKLQALLNVWKSMYCDADAYQTCERFKRSERGERVADDLLPNGVSVAEPRK